MEVHHHAHPASRGTQKKWTHYFWEFMMLFLAVFAGFMAENQREHMVEHRRVKESMKEVVENLKYDTTRCRINAESNIKAALGLDSLRDELKKAIKGEINGNALYYYTFYYTGDFGYAVFNTSAITELKNSGSLRLIKNKKIIAGMADYYERKVFAANQMRPSNSQRDALQTRLNEFFDLLNMDNYVKSFDVIRVRDYNNDYDPSEILDQQPALRLLNESPKDLQKLYTDITLFEIQLKKYNFWLYHVRDAAVKLIGEIREEYHLR